MHRQLGAPEHRDPRFHHVLLTLSCLTLLLFTPGLSAADEVSWELVQNPSKACEMPQGYQIACGDYGVFVLDPQPREFMALQPCDVDFSGSENPPGFTVRKTAVHPGMSISIATSLITLKGMSTLPDPGVLAAQERARRMQPTLKAHAPDLPCSRGSCFADNSKPLRHPWMAVLDWNDWHGWTVGWTASTLTNHEIPVAHYSFDELDSEALGEGTTDLHLLALTCKIAEDVDKNGYDSPAVLNLSLGRPPVATDEEPPGECQYLNCQVGRVLEHLSAPDQRGVPKTVIVGAAGNHKEAQTPAIHDSVLATGMMDLADFNADQDLNRAWEMVDSKDLESLNLMVGYNICLTYWSHGEERSWEAPAGSSYAAAALAGWLARQQVHAPTPDLGSQPLVPAWKPKPEGGHQSIYLTQGDEVLLEYPDAARALLARAFGKSQLPCGTKHDQSPDVLKVFDKPVPVPTTTLGESIVGGSDVNNPNPEPQPCTPCQAIIDDGGYFAKSHFGLKALAQPGSSIGIGGTAPKPKEKPVYIDMTAHSDLPDRQSLEWVGLRLGDEIYDFGLTPNQLDGFETGRYTHLQLDDHFSLFCSNQQPSLVYGFKVEGEVEERWSSTPIALLGSSWKHCSDSL